MLLGSRIIKNYLPLVGFSRFLLRRFGEERCFQVAGSLTFTTLLSIIPILTIALTLISAFPVFSGFTNQIKHFILSNLVPDSSTKLITVYLQQFSANAAKLTAVGLAFLAVTALALMLTIDHAFNTIWRVSKRRNMLHQVMIYWGILTIGPILIGASLSLTSWLMSRSLEIVHSLPIMLKLVPILLTVLALTLLYLIVPNRKIRLIHAAAGGVVAGIAFELMKLGFGWYIKQFPTYTLVYGAFASVPIFLLWIFLSWLVVLSGAVLTASLPYWHQAAWKQKRFPGREFFETLRVIEALYRARETGRSLDLYQLQWKVPLGFDRIEQILERLAMIEWIKETVDDGWVLSIDASSVTLAQLYRRTVLNPVQIPTIDGILPLHWRERVISAIDSELGVSLQTIFDEQDQVQIKDSL